MNVVQYIIANQGVGMSPGKLAAQVAHASVKGYELTLGTVSPVRDDKTIAAWNDTGHAKIVLSARDTEHLLTTERYLIERGHRVALIVDEGRTEVPPLTPTALGVELLDKDDEYIKFSFSTFKTYREPKPEKTLETDRRFLPHYRWLWRR